MWWILYLVVDKIELNAEESLACTGWLKRKACGSFFVTYYNILTLLHFWMFVVVLVVFYNCYNYCYYYYYIITVKPLLCAIGKQCIPWC